MSNYKSLRILSYDSSFDVLSELDKRKTGYGTFVTPLIINPISRGMRQSESFNLFVVTTPELQSLEEKIQMNSRRILQLTSKLPAAASEKFFLNTLFEEIYSTNEIEGVKTTPTEINDAINAALSDSSTPIRMKSFVNMYLAIQDGKVLKIRQPADLRKIYDKLLEGEISKKDLPDGQYFRNRFVRIGTDVKTVHQPKTHESEFLPDIDTLVQFMNSHDFPVLIKTFLTHYYFEYIHPFNDGNGRTGRYIACVYLGKKLDYLTAISFSHQISEAKSKYYKAFEETENSRNFGEATFFVLDMLKLLSSGQDEIINSLEKGYNDWQLIKNNIDQNTNFSAVQKSLVDLLSQEFLFNPLGSGMRDEEIKKYAMDIPNTRIRKELDHLTESGYVKILKKRPLTRKLTKDCTDSLLREAKVD